MGGVVMKKTLMIIKRYQFVIGILLILAILSIFLPEIGKKTWANTIDQVLQMLLIIPPVFIMLGLLDVWVPRETMTKYMGDKSGFRGILIAFLIGSMAAGPLYGAFPVAAVLIKKGARFSNVLIFLGAWSTTKIPMLLFEYSSLGWRFATTRLIVDLFGIFIIARLIEIFLKKPEIDKIYQTAAEMEEPQKKS